MKDSTQLAIIVGGAAVVAYVIYRAVPKVAEVAGGIVSGNNTLTRGARDADGRPTTAYQGAGVVGTVGAAANAASGGYLATLGSWLGGKTYDLFNTDPLATAAPSSSIDRYNRPPSTSSGADYDETDRLVARYPAPVVFKDQFDALGNYTGSW